MTAISKLRSRRLGVAEASGSAVSGDPSQSTITGNFVQSDLQNSSTYRNRSFGGSFSTAPGSIPSINPGLTSPQREQGVTRSGITGTVNGTVQTGSPVTLDRAAVLAAYDDGKPYTAEGQPSLSKFKAQPAEMAEKQEAAAMFSKDASKTVGDLSAAMGWEEGSLPKVVLHGAVGAATARLGGGNPALGAVVGGVNEGALPTLDRLAQQAGLEKGKFAYNAAMQLGSIALGSAVGGLIGADAMSSGGIAGAATQNNYLSHQDVGNLKVDIKKCKTNRACVQRAIDKYEKKTLAQVNGYVFEKCKSAGANVQSCVERELQSAERAKNELLDARSEFWQGLSMEEKLIVSSPIRNGIIGNTQNAMFRDPRGNGNSDFNGMVRNCLGKGATSVGDNFSLTSFQTGKTNSRPHQA